MTPKCFIKELSYEMRSSEAHAPAVSTIEGGRRAEQALPPQLLNLFELSNLESQGVAVQWPHGLDTASAHAIIFDFFSPMIIREHVEDIPSAPAANPEEAISSSQSLSDSQRATLSDLLSLSDSGETVIWPEGITAEVARQLIG